MRLIIHISPQEFPDSVQPWLRSKVLECRSLGIPWWPTPRLWNKLWKWLGTGCRYQPSKFTLQLHIKWLKRWSIEPCTYFKKFCLSNRSALLIPHYPMSMWKIPGVCDPRRHSAKAVMDLKTCADCVQHHLQQTALATGRKDPANVGILGNRLTWKRWWCMFRVWKWRAREWMPHHGWRRWCRRWWWWWCSHGNSRELLGYDWLSLDKSKHCIHDFPNFLAKKNACSLRFCSSNRSCGPRWRNCFEGGEHQFSKIHLPLLKFQIQLYSSVSRMPSLLNQVVLSTRYTTVAMEPLLLA